MNIEIKEYEKKRTVYLTEDIDCTTTFDIEAAIQEIIDKDHEVYEANLHALSALGSHYVEVYTKENVFPEIVLCINCAGGSVYDGIGLYDYIRHINEETDHKVKVVCQGCVASMATIVMLASDDRVAMKNTSFLIHSLSDLAIGKLQEMEDNLIECKRLNELMNNIYLKHTKLTKTKLKEIDKAKKDWWFGVDKALELGLINKII